MTFISYAQNFEDIMLWRALKHIKKGFYIDVGAFSPHDDSITKFFYEHQNWKGINIEPNFTQHQEFLIHRPRDINLPLAIGNQEKHLEFYIIKDPSNKNTGLSTFSKTIAQKHYTQGYSIKNKTIQVITLEQLFEKYVPPLQEIHFLKLDVEGFEQEVIQSNRWEHYQPWIILVEAISPVDYQETYQTWEPLLLSAGYSFVYSDQLNRFYVSSKHTELSQAFKYPPNIFDSFVIYNQIKPFIQQNKINEKRKIILAKRIVLKNIRSLWSHLNFLFKLINHFFKGLFSSIIKKI